MPRQHLSPSRQLRAVARRSFAEQARWFLGAVWTKTVFSRGDKAKEHVWAMCNNAVIADGGRVDGHALPPAATLRFVALNTAWSSAGEKVMQLSEIRARQHGLGLTTTPGSLSLLEFLMIFYLSLIHI